MTVQTYGNLYAIDCPRCGENIRDLDNVHEGSRVECPRCRRVSVIEDYRIEITLRAEDKEIASERKDGEP